MKDFDRDLNAAKYQWLLARSYITLDEDGNLIFVATLREATEVEVQSVSTIDKPDDVDAVIEAEATPPAGGRETP